MEIEINVLGYIVTLEVHATDDVVYIDWIERIDGEEPEFGENDDADILLCELIATHYSDELHTEYKRVCEQENGDLMIDRHLTESMD